MERFSENLLKITSKLILPSISRFKFCLHYRSKIKQLKLITERLAPTNSAQSHYHNFRIMLCNLFWIYLLSQKKLIKVGL